MVELAMTILNGKKLDEIELRDLVELIDGKELVVDYGTGDGKFAYQYAKENPEVFVLGIDSDTKNMVEQSIKSIKKPAKGGLENLLYISASIEDIPEELTNQVSKMYINFPWAGLLAAVIKPMPEVIFNISATLKTGSKLVIRTTYNTKYEPETIEKLDLPELNPSHIKKLEDIYNSTGLVLQRYKILEEEDLSNIRSSWLKQITANRDRVVWELEFIKE